MQNIARIKEVLDSLDSITREYLQCSSPEHSELLRKNISSAKRQLLDAYNPEVSARFDNLDAMLHSLLKMHFNSLVLSIGDLHQVHETRIRGRSIDADTFHNLILTHIHPIIPQIDQRLLAMHAALQGLGVAAKRNP